MAYFLVKTDPETYSIDQLERDGRTVWDGVRSPQAVRAIQSMRPGDTLLVYHSMGQPAIVGVARVVSEPRPDPAVAKSTVVDVAFVRRLPEPVALRAIKETHRFDDWLLIRQGRLSTMSVPPEVVEWLKQRQALEEGE